MALTDEERAIVAATCARRAELELHGASAFHLVTDSLRRLRAPPAIVALSEQAIGEERAHAEIYRRLAVRNGAPDLPLPPQPVLDVPAHASAPPSLRPALHVVGMCAINETMACAFLDCCLRGATDDNVREGVRAVLADEIRHGRIGWAWLASISVEDRRAIVPWVLPLARVQLAGWRAQIATPPPPAVPSHGCPSGAAIEASALSALADLVLPGFAHLDMNVADTRVWLSAGAPTDDATA